MATVPYEENNSCRACIFIKSITICGKDIWVKVFKNGPSKICGRQLLKNFTWSILEYIDSHYPSAEKLTGGKSN